MKFPLTQALLQFWQLLDWRLYKSKPTSQLAALNLAEISVYICDLTNERAASGIPKYHA